MDTKQQPEALRLAEMLTAGEWPGSVTLVSYARECVAELLRQHAENETVRAGYAAARLEIESLKAQLHAAKKKNQRGPVWAACSIHPRQCPARIPWASTGTHKPELQIRAEETGDSVGVRASTGSQRAGGCCAVSLAA